MEHATLFNLKNRHQTSLRTIVFLLLLCISILLVITGYTYYGIYQAQELQPRARVEHKETVPDSISTKLSDSQKAAVLNSLSKGSTAVASEEKQMVLESITDDNTPVTTQAEKQAIFRLINK